MVLLGGESGFAIFVFGNFTALIGQFVTFHIHRFKSVHLQGGSSNECGKVDSEGCVPYF